MTDTTEDGLYGNKPTCPNCGSDKVAVTTNESNGHGLKCRQCGNEF
jgi:transcription elongation factor Elf1